MHKQSCINIFNLKTFSSCHTLFSNRLGGNSGPRKWRKYNMQQFLECSSMLWKVIGWISGLMMHFSYHSLVTPVALEVVNWQFSPCQFLCDSGLGSSLDYMQGVPGFIPIPTLHGFSPPCYTSKNYTFKNALCYGEGGSRFDPSPTLHFCSFLLHLPKL